MFSLISDNLSTGFIIIRKSEVKLSRYFDVLGYGC